MAGVFVKTSRARLRHRFLTLRKGMPMELFVKGRRIRIELPPIILATLFMAWSIYYYIATMNTPHGGGRSVLFIRPLTLLLLICYPFVVGSFVKFVSEKEPSGQGASETQPDADRGFRDPRRIFFAASLAAYALGLTFLGYMIPTVLFVFIVCFYLGVRNLWILTGLPLLLSIFLAVVFRAFIGVPIPIWPW